MCLIIYWRKGFLKVTLTYNIDKINIFLIEMITYKFRGVQGRGAEPPGPARRDSFDITFACFSLPQEIYILHCIALTQTKD